MQTSDNTQIHAINSTLNSIPKQSTGCPYPTQNHKMGVHSTQVLFQQTLKRRHHILMVGLFTDLVACTSQNHAITATPRCVAHITGNASPKQSTPDQHTPNTIKQGSHTEGLLCQQTYKIAVQSSAVIICSSCCQHKHPLNRGNQGYPNLGVVVFEGNQKEQW